MLIKISMNFNFMVDLNYLCSGHLSDHLISVLKSRVKTICKPILIMLIKIVHVLVRQHLAQLKVIGSSADVLLIVYIKFRESRTNFSVH